MEEAFLAKEELGFLFFGERSLVRRNNGFHLRILVTSNERFAFIGLERAIVPQMGS